MGGVEQYTKNLALSLNALNCDITVVTSEYPALHKSCESTSPINVEYIPSKVLMRGRFPLLMPSKKLAAIWENLIVSSFDLIIVNTRYYPLSLLGLHLAKKTAIPALLIDHSSNYLSTDSRFLKKIIRLYEQCVTNAVKYYAPQCYGVSIKSCSWLSELGLEPKGVLPNSIDANVYTSLTSKRNYKEEFNIPRNSTIVSFAGRLVAEKGAHKVLDACNKLQSSSLHLFIAGDGEQLSSLSTYAGSNIHILGKLSQADLSALLSQTDIFCFPSDYPEGLPTVLLEAGSHKCAIIMSDTGGAEDLIPSKEFGIVLQTTESQEIAQTLEYLCDHKDEARHMGDNVCHRIEKHFSWQVTARKILDSNTGRKPVQSPL